MKDWNNYLKEGYVGHLEESGALEFGDGAQRLGMLYLFGIDHSAPMKWEFSNLVRALELPSGELVRCPPRIKDDWYSRPGTMSRDNLFPILCAALVLRDYSTIKWIFFKLLRRGFFLWNTKKIGQHSDEKKLPDVCGPKTMLVFARALVASLGIPGLVLWPILVALDLYLILDVLYRLAQVTIVKTESGDGLNVTCALEAYRKVLPTPSSWFARQIYGAFHPGAAPGEPYENYPRVVGFGPLTDFIAYFYKPSAPPFDEYVESTLLQKEW